MSAPVLIIAGKYLEARYYASSRELGPDSWIWVKDVKVLTDNPDKAVILTGKFSGRLDATELLETVKAQQMPMQHEPDLFGDQ